MMTIPLTTLRILRNRRGWPTLALALFAISEGCTDSSGPKDAVGKVPAFLIGASDTIIVATVGSSITNVEPAVIVEDASHVPVVGTMVIFTIEGPGNNSQVSVSTDLNGVAKLVDWRLSTIAGPNVATATIAGIAPVRFRATGMAGPAASIIAFRGEGQAVPLGSTVPIPPAVRVIDTYGNSKPGIDVTFRIEHGDSFLQDSIFATDTVGVATVTAWTLRSAGRHSLLVTASDLAPARFTATAFASRLSCGQENELFDRVRVESELGSQSCTDSEGRKFDLLSATAPAATAWYSFSLRSQDFDAYLELLDVSGRTIATNDNASTGTDSEILALLPSGPLTVSAGGAQAGSTGKYSVEFDRMALPDNRCEPVFTTRGVSIERDLAPLACDSPPATEPFGDQYKIFLERGTPLEVALTDLGYSDWKLQLYEPNGGLVMESVNIGSYEYALRFTPERAGYYTIRVTSGDTYTRYYLTIK